MILAFDELYILVEISILDVYLPELQYHLLCMYHDSNLRYHEDYQLAKSYQIAGHFEWCLINSDNVFEIIYGKDTSKGVFSFMMT